MSGTHWTNFVAGLHHEPALDLFLDLSHLPISQAQRDALQPAFARAFEQMHALESGAIANPDENRMVGHYWLRDPGRAPSPELRAQIGDMTEAVAAFAAQVREGRIKPPGEPRFETFLTIGIGGSALGPQFFAGALRKMRGGLSAQFIDNTDPDGIDRVLATPAVNLARTLVIVISKSGSTAETRNGLVEVQHAFTKAGIDFASRAVAVTGQDSLLDRQAVTEGWLARFPMWDWVGGRTSVFSAVGLLPAALQGIDIDSLLDGAARMDLATRKDVLEKNPAALLAMAWHVAGAGQGAKDMVILPYKDSLLLFSRYLQQLVMESLGKGRDLDGRPVEQGIAVYGNKGSTDQHAYVQQLREGVANFFVTFIEVLEDRTGPSMEVEPGVTSGDFLSGFLHGTREALSENDRGSLTITIPRVDALRVGALVALYERAVGLYASVVNINAYHQPGVEAGKKAAARQLDLQKRVLAVLADAGAPRTITELAAAAGAVGEEHAVYHLLRHLAANARSVAFEGDAGRPDLIRVRAV